MNLFAPHGTNYGIHFPVVVGCDLPEQGGISGNSRPRKPLPPYVLEERPKIYNWKTGEWEYLDEHIRNQGHVCWIA